METLEQRLKRIKNEPLYCISCKRYTKHDIEGGMILYTGCRKCGQEFTYSSMLGENFNFETKLLKTPWLIRPFKRMKNAGTIITAIVIMILSIMCSFWLTHFIHDVFSLRLIWAACAVIGYRLLRHARPEFYTNRSGFFWIWLVLMYFCLGPAILGLGVIVTICPPLKY